MSPAQSTTSDWQLYIWISPDLEQNAPLQYCIYIEVSIINSVVLCEALAFHLQEAESVYVSSQLNSGRFLHLSVTQEKEAERTKDYQRHKVRKLPVVSGKLDFRLNKTAFSIYSTRIVNL